VTQGHVHKSLLDKAWTGWQRERVAKLHQSVVGGVLRAVEIVLDEFALLRWTIPMARERVNVFDRNRMCETDPGALVKATLLQKSITVQDVAYVGQTRTAGSAPEVVKQPEYVRLLWLQTRVAARQSTEPREQPPSSGRAMAPDSARQPAGAARALQRSSEA
jgi:hypothetical protein